MAEQIQKFDLATPEQAGAVFEAVELKALLVGEDNGTRFTVPNIPIDIPDVIAAYLPEGDLGTGDQTSSLTITQYKDSESGLPVRKGLLGKLSFEQTQARVDGLPLIKSVGYLIISEGGRVHQLERRTSVLDGEKPHVGRTIGERILEIESGQVTNDVSVGRQEAQAILDVLSGLGSESQSAPG